MEGEVMTRNALCMHLPAAQQEPELQKTLQVLKEWGVSQGRPKVTDLTWTPSWAGAAKSPTDGCISSSQPWPGKHSSV